MCLHPQCLRDPQHAVGLRPRLCRLETNRERAKGFDILLTASERNKILLHQHVQRERRSENKVGFCWVMWLLCQKTHAEHSEKESRMNSTEPSDWSDSNTLEPCRKSQSQSQHTTDVEKKVVARIRWSYYCWLPYNNKQHWCRQSWSSKVLIRRGNSVYLSSGFTKCWYPSSLVNSLTVSGKCWRGFIP